MPTNRTRRTRKFATITLDSCGVMDRISFMNGWCPPIDEFERIRARWPSWEQYFADYDAVRDELLADPEIQRVYGDKVLFADQVRSTLLQDGEVYDAHRHRALQHAHPYVRGVEHVHDGYVGMLGPAREVREEAVGCQSQRA